MSPIFFKFLDHFILSKNAEQLTYEEMTDDELDKQYEELKRQREERKKRRKEKDFEM